MIKWKVVDIIRDSSVGSIRLKIEGDNGRRTERYVSPYELGLIGGKGMVFESDCTDPDRALDDRINSVEKGS